MRDIRLVDRVFMPGTLIGPFTQANPGLGGVCTFVGEVRSGADSILFIECLLNGPSTPLAAARLTLGRRPAAKRRAGLTPSF